MRRGVWAGGGREASPAAVLVCSVAGPSCPAFCPPPPPPGTGPHRPRPRSLRASVPFSAGSCSSPCFSLKHTHGRQTQRFSFFSHMYLQPRTRHFHLFVPGFTKVRPASSSHLILRDLLLCARSTVMPLKSFSSLPSFINKAYVSVTASQKQQCGE